MAYRVLWHLARRAQALAPYPPHARAAGTAAALVAATASLASLPVIVAAELNADPFVRESARVQHDTGVSFDVALSPTRELAGVGARFMRGLVKVYAVGVYFDPRRTVRVLDRWRGFDAHNILHADPLWAVLCEGDQLPVTLRMVVVRQVVGSHMQHGFERQLLPRVAAAAKMGSCRPADCRADAKRFCALFAQVGTMKVGSDVRIAVDGHVVSLSVDGRLLGELSSKQLATSLLDMFLGHKSVVNGLRDDVAVGLEQLLS